MPPQLQSPEIQAFASGLPLTLEGLGCIGAITVSGLPQVEDHGLVVQVLERVLGH